MQGVILFMNIVTENAENKKNKNKMKIVEYTDLCGSVDVTYVHGQRDKFFIFQAKLLQVTKNYRTVYNIYNLTGLCRFRKYR